MAVPSAVLQRAFPPPRAEGVDFFRRPGDPSTPRLRRGGGGWGPPEASAKAATGIHSHRFW